MGFNEYKSNAIFLTIKQDNSFSRIWWKIYSPFLTDIWFHIRDISWEKKVFPTSCSIVLFKDKRRLTAGNFVDGTKE